MEYGKELEATIGEENIKLSEIQHVHITRAQLKAIALRMCGEVHGVFVHSERDLPPHHLCWRMLDCWYNYKLCDPDIDSREELIKILVFDEIGLQALAHRMRFGECQAVETVERLSGLSLDTELQGDKTPVVKMSGQRDLDSQQSKLNIDQNSEETSDEFFLSFGSILSDNEPKSKLDQFVQEISKNIPLILNSLLELAIQSLELAMKLAKDKKCKEAYTHFVVVLGKAFEALLQR